MFLKLIIMYLVIHLVQSDHCTHVLKQLSNAQMDFVQCVTVNSVPVTVCIGCAGKHEDVLQMYDLLAANCSDTYFDKDRINLIASTELALTGLWSKAYCDDCYNNNNNAVFTEKNTNFYNCVGNNSNASICVNCKLLYMDLNDFYIKLDQHNNGEVCYDLQDSMNRTRNKWSKEYNCCRREQNLTLFVITLFITSCLPMLFYGTTFCLTKRRERQQRVLFNEDPYVSDVPSSSRPHSVNVNNPTHAKLDNLPSSSGGDPTKIINDDSVQDEEEDDEPLMYSTSSPMEKIKNI